jgi:DNA-binding transcriptional LysR family regulator
MRGLNLDQMQTLVAIADLGTFAAAARSLHLAPPTVSLQIAELESRLGAPLLERGNRQARLTPAGTALVASGRRLLKDADEAMEQVRRIARGREGKVRVGASSGVVVHLLPRVLEALAQRSPGIDVELDILGTNDTLARLQAGTLEIGIVALPLPTVPEVRTSRWRTDPMVAFLPPQWDAPKTVSPSWLARQPLIANDVTTHMHRLVAEWFARAGLAPRARIELNATEAMKNLVAAGYGAAVLPLELPYDATLHARLQVRPLRPALKRHLGLAYRAQATLDAASATVIDVLRTFGVRSET